MSQKVKLFRNKDRQYFFKSLKRKFWRTKLVGERYYEDHLPQQGSGWSMPQAQHELFVGSSL